MEFTYWGDQLRQTTAMHVKRGKFELSSGGTSDWYLDFREIAFAYPQHVATVANEAVRSMFTTPYIAAGVVLGGVPIAVAMASVAAQNVSLAIRPEPKEHGTKKCVEGATQFVGTRPLIVVDDVFTMGTSLRKAAQRYQEEYHLLPDAYLVMFNRQLKHGGVFRWHGGKPLISVYGRVDIGVE